MCDSCNTPQVFSHDDVSVCVRMCTRGHSLVCVTYHTLDTLLHRLENSMQRNSGAYTPYSNSLSGFCSQRSKCATTACAASAPHSPAPTAAWASARKAARPSSWWSPWGPWLHHACWRMGPHVARCHALQHATGGHHTHHCCSHGVGTRCSHHHGGVDAARHACGLRHAHHVGRSGSCSRILHHAGVWRHHASTGSAHTWWHTRHTTTARATHASTGSANA